MSDAKELMSGPDITTYLRGKLEVSTRGSFLMNNADAEAVLSEIERLRRIEDAALKTLDLAEHLPALAEALDAPRENKL